MFARRGVLLRVIFVIVHYICNKQDVMIKDDVKPNINVEPTHNPSVVVTQALIAIDRGVQRVPNASRIQAFKVIGENKLATVLEGGVEEALEEVNVTCGDKVRTCCHLLRRYESFADKILDVDQGLTEGPMHILGKGYHHVWLRFRVGYEGRTMQDLISVLHREANAVLGLRKTGVMDGLLYKLVAQNEFHVFMHVKNPDNADDVSWHVPVMKELGDCTQLSCKPIKILD